MARQDHRLGSIVFSGKGSDLYIGYDRITNIDEVKGWLTENSHDAWDVMWDLRASTTKNWDHHYVIMFRNEIDAVAYKIRFGGI